MRIPCGERAGRDIQRGEPGASHPIDGREATTDVERARVGRVDGQSIDITDEVPRIPRGHVAAGVEVRDVAVRLALHVLERATDESAAAAVGDRGVDVPDDRWVDAGNRARGAAQR
jgi:hypothetical protein